MLTFFRNFFKSKIGLAITLAFLGLIGFAFASMDVSNTGAFGGVAGGDSVAVVGDKKIGTAEFQQAVNDALAEARRDNPDVTMEQLLANGGIDRILDDLIDRYTLIAWGEENGFRAGDNLVNYLIRDLPGVRGPEGEFDQEAYAALLQQAQLTDAEVRSQIRTSLFEQQAVGATVSSAKLPEKLALAYARTFKERRSGAIATIPARLFVPTEAPSDEVLVEFYNEEQSRFVRPERRVLRYATFGSEALGDSILPTDEEIAAYYEDNSEEFAANETRTFTQLIVATRQGAEAIATRVNAGETIAQAASSAGFNTTQIEGATREELREQVAGSGNVVEAYFSASQGSLTSPARSSLGWHIARVDGVTQIPARSLAQARDEIAEILGQEKRERGIAELAVSTEDRLVDGASLQSIAEEFGLDLQTTAPITARGEVYGTPQRVDPVLAPALKLAFQIGEGQPEIGALPDGETFILYEVADIAPSAAAPLSEIRDEVTAEWRRVRGNELAEAAAARIVKRVEEGRSLAQAVAAEEAAIPAPDQVEYTREQLARLQGRNVPTPVALLFGMAEGTTKKLDGTNDQGWYVVDLASISFDELEEDDPLIEIAKAQVGQNWSGEYAAQLRRAMRESIGVERNPDAIAAVRRQLLGENN
ncbi:MAG: peptidylprolyl isomerase [Erythrobacter sp.]|nr:peptidylprolyl isomerase [Erythrobacter sp.]